MMYWKNITIDPALILDLQQRYRTVLPNNSHFFQFVDPGITEFLGLELFRCVLIQAGPNAAGRLHIDHRPADNNVLALNIPLDNCQDSVTEMFTSDISNQKVEYTQVGTPYVGYNIKDCIKVAEFKLDSPVMFRTDVPHRVVNHSNKPRLAISLRFKKDPWHLVSVL